MLSNEKIYQVFLSLPLPILVLEPVGSQFRIVEANKNYQALTRTSRRDLIGNTIPESLPGNGFLCENSLRLIQASCEEVLQKAKTSKIDKVQYHIPVPGSSEGDIRYWNIENSPILNEKGEVEHILQVIKDITEVEKRREEQELDSRKFRALVQEGSDIMAILDQEGNYTFASATTFKILGIKPEEILGTNVFEHIHPKDREKLKTQFQELIKGKQLKVAPFRYSDKRGNWVWLETVATNLLDDPAVRGIVTNSRNITTILEQAREIDHINERYHLAATATQDLIYDWDLENDKVRRYHDSPTKLFGYTEKEVTTRKFWRTHIHPSDAQAIREKLRRTLNNTSENLIHSEYRFRRADGSYALVMDKGYILRNSAGKAIRLVGATTDISDITIKEEALKTANERFQLAMDATNEMIYDWDIESNVMIRSKAFEDIYGYSLSEDYPANEFWFSRTVNNSRKWVNKSLKRALKNKKQYLWREEYAVLRADDSIAHVIDRASILRNKEGKAIRMVGAVLDVTQSLRLLNEVQKQNTILREIAWEQSHVVRAPLARLKGLIDLLELQGFEDEEQQKILQHINESANELDLIVKKIVAKTEEIGEGER